MNPINQLGVTNFPVDCRLITVYDCWNGRYDFFAHSPNQQNEFNKKSFKLVFPATGIFLWLRLWDHGVPGAKKYKNQYTILNFLRH